MPNEPINIFSARGDAEQVRSLLLTWFPKAKVSTKGNNWSEIQVKLKDGTLTIRHHRDYYAGSNWAAQKAGMQNYFRGFPLGERESQTMATIGSFQFALSTQFDPDYDPPHDERLAVVSKLTEVLDGVLFSPSALRDANGRILVSADGEVDDDAQWPKVGRLVQTADFGERAGAGEKPAVTDEDDWQPEPPDAERVARRAVALLIVSARAVAERDHHNVDVVPFYKRLLAWTETLNIDDEFEAWEREALHSAPGKLVQQTAINAMWRIEGLSVLTWALGRAKLLQYDQISDVDGLWEALGLFDDDRVRELLGNPQLRSADELETFRKQMLGYHWRLRDFRWRQPTTMDFLAFARNCWFGSFDVSSFKLIDNDLALQGKRIDKVGPDVLGLCLSIATERHQAINWLCWGPEVYSEADLST